MREKTPVYLAKENSFEPDPSRTLTAEQMERLRHLSRQYRDIIRNARHANGITPNPTHRQPLQGPTDHHPHPQQLDE